ncbi:hypothetical protein J113_22390 [Mycobacterium tuberculosis CAS/NITR204]|uniref:Uncharacterized protein n=1 Tax=Mycobacterium tuberculosis CAS/NITR204 TaxID=1310114 RepID=R4MCQ3_MYCTX|nr:hypothetical protein J113_22390 [Mycobacterium tuberculosis CAS/NITR204]
MTQLAGGDYDQGPRSASERSRAVAGGDALQQRHAKSERFAHAGAGLADHVLAVEREWQGGFLDSKGPFDALFP